MTDVPAPAPLNGTTPPQKSQTVAGLAFGCGLILLFGLAAISRPLYIYFLNIKASDVYRDAYMRAASDPRVIERLGTPIEKSWWVFGRLHGGIANIKFTISGLKGRARVRVSATMQNKKWSYTTLIVCPETGSEIDVLRP